MPSVDLSKQEIIALLETEGERELKDLCRRAYDVKMENVGKKVYYRGLIEFSNVCKKNCYYCGIRRDNRNVSRYCMSEDEIVEAALWAHGCGYGSVVLQSGERSDAEFVDFVERAVSRIKKESGGELGITLSLGEQGRETYERWFKAGAHRYLIRIETSNRELYAKLHPEDHDFNARLRCIENLRDIGYQVGTGVMIGLPGQNVEDLANDILFFRDNDIDMIGMGPYIPHKDTPMGESLKWGEKEKRTWLELALKMIAATRITLRDVNIASTTALQALDPKGREMGLEAGANIIMPNITATKYRSQYKLYEDKPCMDENSMMCRSCLEARIDSVGEEIGYKEWGDSPHYFKRMKKE
ncbi:MAG: [FeFe] hydrogenase H-cluster radical SAM maturase HydE [Thermoplasmata archaeon HGW-Thermoplasmata-1]|nr:MAG: [FeFe] hydrogenase H-cluster radical SAM maturase HydE [Thermoplasmata archaeon HGW-Thermoplasmata-1]